MANLKDRSLEELHTILREKYQFENPESLRSKKSAQAVIQNLEARAAALQPSEKVSDANRRVSQEVEKMRHMSKKERMKKILAKQPKIRMMIPLTGKEVKGQAFESVIINGYRTGHKGEGTDWPKGVYVDVPKQVADMLEKAYNQTSDLGSSLRADRSPEVEQALA